MLSTNTIVNNYRVSNTDRILHVSIVLCINLVEMSKEESLLKSYFTFISNFSHDRAREVVEREKDVVRTGPGSTFNQLVVGLVSLAGAEKQYLSLSFLLPRTSSVFLRKEQSLKSVYQSILLDVRNAMELEADVLVSRTCEDLLRLLQVRVTMIGVYEKLCQFSSSTSSDSYTELVTTLKTVLEEIQLSPSELCDPWIIVLRYEAGVLLDCLTLTITMLEWNFFDSVMLLQRIGESLAMWDQVVQARETRKLSFASSWLRGVSGSVEPHLYLWLQKLKSSLLSKFSLYFYSTLSQQTRDSTEMKVLCAKLSVDHTARLSSFQKRLDCQSVSILYEAAGQGYQGRPGYHFQDTSDQAAHSGLELFPLVFSTGQPEPHWPNIVMIISDLHHAEQLKADRTVHFFDGGVGATYFIHRIEQRFYIVLIFEGRRNEKDSAINSFIQETASQLSCVRIFTSLKPGYK